MVKFKFVEENEASEPQATTETHIPKEAIFEPEKSFISENIEIEKIESEKPEKSMLNENIIDFTALANTSDFKRLIYLGITGKVWRGTNSGLEISLKKLKNRLKK